jgi:hypothetical protein
VLPVKKLRSWQLYNFLSSYTNFRIKKVIQVELVVCVMAVRSACRIWVGKIQGKKTWRSDRLMLHVTTFVQKMEAVGFSKTLVPVYQIP